MTEETIVENILKKLGSACRFVIKRVAISAIVIVLGMTLAYFGLKQLNNKFIARITFFSENDNAGKLGGYAGLASQLGFDIGLGGSDAFSGENIIEILKSKYILEKTLLLPTTSSSERLFIDDYFKNHKKFKVETNFSSIADQRLKDSLLNDVIDDIGKSQLTVDKLNNLSDIMYLDFKDNDEVFAKQFAQTVVNTTINFYVAYKTEKSLQNVALLQRQVDSLRGLLYGRIDVLASISDLNVNPLKQSGRTDAQKKQSEMQVNSILYGELLKNLELSKIALQKQKPLIQIIDTPRLPLKNKQFTALQAVLLGGLSSFIFYFLLVFGLQFVKKNAI
jgi:hypothetical protein